MEKFTTGSPRRGHFIARRSLEDDLFGVCDDSISYYESCAGVLQKAKRWCAEYLFHRVQRGQELRQNHVHIWNERGHMHVPLSLIHI
eukprot:1751227-Karenia_brevis.AAC.1